VKEQEGEVQGEAGARLVREVFRRLSQMRGLLAVMAVAYLAPMVLVVALSFGNTA
jgi:cell division protein FtsX